MAINILKRLAIGLHHQLEKLSVSDAMPLVAGCLASCTLITRPLHQPSNATIPDLRKPSAPMYQISAKSNNPARLS